MFRAALNQTESGAYRASVNTDGDTERLGRFADPVRAALAILTAASRHMETKTNAEVAGMVIEPPTFLSTFLSTVAYYSPGEVMRFSEFCERFWNFLPKDQKARWHRQRIIRCLPTKFPFGAHTGNQRCVGNIAWCPASGSRQIAILDNGRLKLVPHKT